MAEKPARAPGSLVERRREPFPWKHRRMYLYVTTAFHIAVVAYVLIMNLTSAVADTAVFASIGAVAANVAIYSLGATWQDVTLIRARRAADDAVAGGGE